MVSFIDDHRDVYGVESICRVVPIAPSTYFEHKAQQRCPDRRSARVKRDEVLREKIQTQWDADEQAYGARKMWKALKRAKVPGGAPDAGYGPFGRGSRQGVQADDDGR